jgi:hypothetical protein
MPGEVGVVAEAASVLRRKGSSPRHGGRVGNLFSGCRRGQPREALGVRAQVVVAEVLRQLVHRLAEPLFLTELVELDQKEIGRLTPEGGDLRSLGSTAFSVTGEARGEAFRERLGQSRRRDPAEKDQPDEELAAQAIPPS